MSITYTEHIKNRLFLRKIDYSLPKAIFEQAVERFVDVETGHMIAVMEAELYSKIREVMVAYIAEGESVKLLTIHPLKRGQKEDRVRIGRWRKI